jgi:hypothetical protein
MKPALVLAAFLLSLAGCASTGPPTTWAKPGGTSAENDKDDRECNYDAQKVFYANINSPLMGRYLGQQTFDACMKARGYRPSPP